VRYNPARRMAHEAHRFGPFELDAAAFRLLKDGEPVPLSPRAVPGSPEGLRHRCQR
jgi:hypothetical protein